MVEPKRQINAKKNECKLINRFNPLWFHPRSASLVISSSSTALMPCLQAKPQSHKVIRLSMPSIGQSHKEFQILPACGRWRHHQTKLAWEMCRGPKCEALCNFVNLLSQDWTLYGILQVFCSTVFAWNFMKHIFQGFKPCSGSVFQLVFLLRFHAEALAGYQVPEADLPGAFRIEPWKLWKTLARKRKKARAPTTKPMAHKPITFYKPLYDISRIWILHTVAQTLFAGASLEQLAPSRQNSVTRHVVNTSEAGALESILTVLTPPCLYPR